MAVNLPPWLRRLLRRPDPYADAFRRELGNAADSVNVRERESRPGRAAERTIFRSLEETRDT